MEKKFIPIIGAISAGKTTFLRGLLGSDLLETGSITTTKFVCIIKNSDQTKFYHVIPERKNGIELIKEGEEIIGEKNIKEKIKEINKNLMDKQYTKDDIFYMLEMPIKNVENKFLLDECYFMDIPGLNENKNSYMDIIFSIITLDDIKFEIIIFDSTCIGQDNIINILKKLDQKKSLKKTDNLFILNKIDKVFENGEEKVINSFKQYFYENFEDDKNENNSVMINISKNKFITMNSILFLAEAKIKEDFGSMLVVEFYNYIYLIKKEQFPSYYKYLEKRLELNLNRLKEQNVSVNFDFNLITKEEIDNIKKSIDELQNIKKLANADCLIDIKLKNKDIKNNMFKLFILHKNNNLFYDQLKYYNKLNQILNEINNNNLNIQPQQNNIQIINLDEQGKSKKSEIIKSLDEFDNFLRETFKLIDPNKELESFNVNLQSLRENIIGRKLRVSFIGNISVGKSTVLNCIIGEEILPVNYDECTYRGVIIRHEEKGPFKLFKTKLIKRGIGSYEYYYFEDEEKPYCEGINAIKSFLNVKNNDKDIADKDAYLVITGNLKIFEFIKLDKDLISKIEFIDLPGVNRKKNIFNEKEYYKRILKFSNCCIYINEPSSIDDEDSVNMIIKQYINDRNQLCLILRPSFIKTCIFLINKIDLIENESEKIRIKDNIFNKILLIEENLKKDQINISFFSGKLFFEYLNVMNNYVYLLNEEPSKLLLKLYKEYNSNFNYFSNNFKGFIHNKISEVEEKFLPDLSNENDDEEELEPPQDFKDKIKMEIEKLEKNKKLFKNEENVEVIKELYNLYIKLKNKDFSKTNFSCEFFYDLNKAIEYSDKLFKENIKNNVKTFFKDIDILFQKEIKKEEDEVKKGKEKSLERIVDVNANIVNKFIKTQTNIKNIFKIGKTDIDKQIDSEIKNVSEKLRESNNDINLAFENLKEKINEITKTMKDNIKKEIFNLIEEIQKDIEEIDKKLNEKNEDISISDIQTNIGLGKKMFATFAATTALSLIGEVSLANVVTETISATVGGAIGGPIGIAIGFAVGLTASLTYLLIHTFKKTKRYERGLIQFKESMKDDLYEYEKNCLDDLKTLEDDFINKINIRLKAIHMDIFNVDTEDWKEIKLDYFKKKENIMRIVGILV